LCSSVSREEKVGVPEESREKCKDKGNTVSREEKGGVGKDSREECQKEGSSVRK
jgi:hypothetical protein